MPGHDRFVLDDDQDRTPSLQRRDSRAHNRGPASADEAAIEARRYLTRDDPRSLSPQDERRLQRMARFDANSTLAELIRLTIPERFQEAVRG